MNQNQLTNLHQNNMKLNNDYGNEFTGLAGN